MDSTAFPLPNDPDQLKAEVVQLRGQSKKKSSEYNSCLKHTSLLLRKRQFGASADRRTKTNSPCLMKLNWNNCWLSSESPEQDDAEPRVQEKTDSERKKPVRRPLPAHFNRVENTIDLSDEEKAAMGDDWTFIGYDRSEQLAVIPRQHYVIAYKRAKYVPVGGYQKPNIVGE